MQNLMSRSQFARLAGVNPSTITRCVLNSLAGASVGKQIDANHPDAVAYLEKQIRDARPEPAAGVDPLYGDAVEACAVSGRWSVSSIQRSMRIGYNRASRIHGMMKATGVIPANPEPAPPPPAGNFDHIPEELKPKIPHTRGHNAAKETRKKAPASEVLLEVPDDIDEFNDMTLRELIDGFGTDVRFVDWLSATIKIENINEKRLKNATTKGALISKDLVKVAVIDPFNSAHLRLMKDGAKSISAGVISKHAAGAELSEIEAYVSDILGSFIKPVKDKIARVLKNAK